MNMSLCHLLVTPTFIRVHNKLVGHSFPQGPSYLGRKKLIIPFFNPSSIADLPNRSYKQQPPPYFPSANPLVQRRECLDWAVEYHVWQSARAMRKTYANRCSRADSVGKSVGKVWRKCRVVVERKLTHGENLLFERQRPCYSPRHASGPRRHEALFCRGRSCRVKELVTSIGNADTLR
jgi:hypothetical protein